MKVTFLTPHQLPTSGGVYAIHQWAMHLAPAHDVTVAVMNGDPRPLDGCTVVPSHAAPDSDVVLYPADIALDSLPDGLYVCLFQGFGTPGNQEVVANLRRNDPVIATARWLFDEAEHLQCPAYYVPYGIDVDLFYPGPPSLDRHPSVLMMTHNADWKGTDDGLEALTLVRSVLPDVSVRLFGVNKPGFDAEYVRAPDRRVVAELMRQTAVFVCSSWEEGFGMPGLEAMACGAAVVTTDTKGSRDYASHGTTALVVPPRQPTQLAGSVRSLLDNQIMRADLVAGAHRMVESYPTWSQSSRILEQSLLRALQGSPA